MCKYTFTLLFGLFSIIAYAQPVVANDSANTGPNNENMVFYSLTDGTKTISSNTDWHMAVSIRPTQFPFSPLGGTTIRINEANGVHVFIAPPVALSIDSAFTFLDTTGWQNWRSIHDIDTSIDEGALNERNTGNVFSFGWGEYDPYTHNVVGDSVYLFQLPGGELKKLTITALVFDTAFDIKCSNIDNSDAINLHIGKGSYTGKEFVYVNLLDDSIHDKEPVASSWDLQFLKYAAKDVTQGASVPVPGVWINRALLSSQTVSIAKATPVDANNNQYSSYTSTTNLNAIGWNWKQSDGNGSYTIQDSLTYFVKATSGLYYKVIFTGYSDTTGEFDFYKMALPFATGINDITENSMKVYPNPVDQTLNISLNTVAETNWKVCDVSGNVVAANVMTDKLARVNTASLPAGMYLLFVTSAGDTQISKFIVAH